MWLIDQKLRYFRKVLAVTLPVVILNMLGLWAITNTWGHLLITVWLLRPTQIQFVERLNRVYIFYRKLRGFSEDCTFMKMFYPCFIESFLTFNFVFWFGLWTCENKNKLLGLVKVCSKVAGTTLSDLTDLLKESPDWSWQTHITRCTRSSNCFPLDADTCCPDAGPADSETLLSLPQLGF